MVDCRCGGGMAGVSPVAAATSPVQQQTPSPFSFSFSVASTRWSSRPFIHLSNICLRFLALVFSFVSALLLAALSPSKNSQLTTSFTDYPEFMYSFIVSILSLIYSSFQLLKAICDIAHRGILISDMISDYTSFILDQLVGYLLMSSSSVAIPVIRRHAQQLTGSLWRAAVISTTISFVTFLVYAASALLSGYRLCKRIIW